MWNIAKFILAENGNLVELNLAWNHLRKKGALSIAKGIWVSLNQVRIKI
jgi:hypothetical protein